MGAFGTAVHIAYPEENAPWLDVVIREMGVFTNAHITTVDFRAIYGQTVLENLTAPQTHSMAAVCCSLGAAFGVYARSGSVLWTFDSHGFEGSGAYARRWESIAAMAETMFASARTARTGVQLTCFRPGHELAA